MKMKKGNSKLYDIFIYLFMIYILIVTLYPFLNVVAISFNESADTVKGTLFVIPRKFTLQNYVTIFSSANNNLLHAFLYICCKNSHRNCFGNYGFLYASVYA